MALSPEQIKEAFNLFDADGSGAVDLEEMSLAMKGLGFEIPKNELLEMVKAIDKDGNSLIEFDEFEKMVTEKMSQRDSPQEVLKAFNLFDLDKTGFVTVQNMIDVTRMLGETTGPDVLKDFIKEADTDKDGKLSFKEWEAVMTAMKGK
eukprot:TRINITY_DN1238_c1_g1_i1.p2 TRINITY_DN1238_c1_g1~~TRINITY_DN1238_c1_g1_i1.p2  ORF type:complete len:148 (+),score=36.08 TRINITY_DN1238_c1_g1_i1:57-500(+)